MINFQFPPYLKPGDSVIAIATSGAVKDVKALETGLDIWRSRGYNVELADHWDARHGYLAGEDKTRLKDFIQAWKDPQYKAILCIRGGYGSARLLEQLAVKNQQSSFKQYFSLSPSKWVIGFSDVTALLWKLATEEIASLHGPILTTLAKEPLWSQQRMFDYLEGKTLEPLRGKGWGSGIAKGSLLPANLSVATHILGTTLKPNLKETILAFEDINEYPYRIDRMLTQWRLMGVLSEVKGIAIGRFSSCDLEPGAMSFTVEEVLRDRLGDLGIPIVSGLPFGHEGVNAILPVGHHVQLDGDRGELKFIKN